MILPGVKVKRTRVLKQNMVRSLGEKPISPWIKLDCDGAALSLPNKTKSYGVLAGRNIRCQKAKDKHILDDAIENYILSEQTLPNKSSLLQHPLRTLIINSHKSQQSHQIWKLLEHSENSHLHRLSRNPSPQYMAAIAYPNSALHLSSLEKGETELAPMQRSFMQIE
ncbi:putative ribosomal-protein-alanine acetyltransferase [Senna tora]|uniref:Putative ribosomal-protein-alanine acetyltransferase n=1 Tax=Senna tora TaxID=362788 RepID=A0A835CI84_9FABA|nr:putative ribosomal-protein-alanine acetyltransferase [Senna tora]